jgi:hypothetical protein
MKILLQKEEEGGSKNRNCILWAREREQEWEWCNKVSKALKIFQLLDDSHWKCESYQKFLLFHNSALLWTMMIIFFCVLLQSELVQRFFFTYRNSEANDDYCFDLDLLTFD